MTSVQKERKKYILTTGRNCNLNYEMKLLLVLGFVCIIQCSWAATPADGVVASMDTGMNQGVSAYEDFLADTANGK